MSAVLAMIHHGALVAAVSGVVYSVTVTAAAITAMVARTPARRRDAREVLKILLRRGGNPQ